MHTEHVPLQWADLNIRRSSKKVDAKSRAKHTRRTQDGNERVASRITQPVGFPFGPPHGWRLICAIENNIDTSHIIMNDTQEQEEEVNVLHGIRDRANDLIMYNQRHHRSATTYR